MIKAQIRRHALKGSGPQKDMLSQEGINQGRQVGETQMKGKGFTHVVVSPFFRTAQTGCAMAEGAGDFTAAKLIVSPALFTERFDEWVAYHKEYGAVIKPEHELVKAEAPRMAREFCELLTKLGENAYPLEIGHTPFLECLIYGLTGQVIDPLKECEGVELEVGDDGDLVRLVAELRD